MKGSKKEGFACFFYLFWPDSTLFPRQAPWCRELLPAWCVIAAHAGAETPYAHIAIDRLVEKVHSNGCSIRD
jgi:hypothetical protein